MLPQSVPILSITIFIVFINLIKEMGFHSCLISICLCALTTNTPINSSKQKEDVASRKEQK